MSPPALSIIGERINPGFKSTRALFENEDIAGIQALARRQAEAGASYLTVNIGNRAVDDARFMREVIGAIQDAVDIPLSFDFPRADVQEVCLSCYDPDKARGRKPIVNSIAESRLDMLDALEIRPARVIVMASERMEDGQMVANTTPREVHAVARRLVHTLRQRQAMANEDIIIDIAISTLAADTRGLTKTALGGMALISGDADLRGVHIMGGLSNIGQQLPKKEFDGLKLQLAIERAFLALAMPLGLDMVLATPWHDLSPLPDGHPVLAAVHELIDLQGVDFLRKLRQFLRS